MKDTKKNKPVNLSIKLDPEIKTVLRDMATRKGMDLSKLARAILTNFANPDTYSL